MTSTSLAYECECDYCCGWCNVEQCALHYLSLSFFRSFSVVLLLGASIKYWKIQFTFWMRKKWKKYEITFWVQWLSITSRSIFISLWCNSTIDCTQLWTKLQQIASSAGYRFRENNHEQTNELVGELPQTELNAAEMLHWPSETLGLEQSIKLLSALCSITITQVQMWICWLWFRSIAVCSGYLPHCCIWVACCAVHIEFNRIMTSEQQWVICRCGCGVHVHHSYVTLFIVWRAVVAYAVWCMNNCKWNYCIFAITMNPMTTFAVMSVQFSNRPAILRCAFARSARFAEPKWLKGKR